MWIGECFLSSPKDRDTSQGTERGPNFGDRALESIEAGKRLSESRFPGVNTAPAGVKSVRSAFNK